MTDDSRRFAAWLVKRARVMGYTQQRLAFAVDVSLSTVQSWWSGRKAPRYEHLLRLRRVLGALPFEEVAR
jgi:transcriptional regulator with XRE-family HTH domain